MPPGAISLLSNIWQLGYSLRKNVLYMSTAFCTIGASQPFFNIVRVSSSHTTNSKPGEDLQRIFANSTYCLRYSLSLIPINVEKQIGMLCEILIGPIISAIFFCCRSFCMVAEISTLLTVSFCVGKYSSVVLSDHRPSFKLSCSTTTGMAD